MKKIRKTIDWNEVKNDYVTGSMSYRALGEKYGIASSSNISRHGRREGWPALRAKYQEELMAQCAKLAAERDTAFLSEMKEKIVRFTRKTADKLAETLDYGEAFSPRDLMNLTGSLSRLQENLNAYRAFDQSPEGSTELVVQFINGEWDNEGP